MSTLGPPKEKIYTLYQLFESRCDTCRYSKGSFFDNPHRKECPKDMKSTEISRYFATNWVIFLRKIIILQILITINVSFIIWWICPKFPKGYNYGQNIFYSIYLLLSSFNIYIIKASYFYGIFHQFHAFTAHFINRTASVANRYHPPFFAHKSHHGPLIHFFIVWKCIEIIYLVIVTS